MSLNTQRKALLVRREAQQGVDALAGVEVAAQASYGIPTLQLDWNPSREDIDREVHTGDFGNDPTPVGYAMATVPTGVDLRGSGVPDQVPDYDDLLLSCGMRRETMRRSIYVAFAGGLDGNDTLVAGERFHRGEQLHGETSYSAAGWGDSVSSSAVLNPGSGAAGQIGDRVKFFPPGGSADSPTATGTIVRINDLANRFTVRFDQGQVARPNSGDFFRVEETNGTLRGFNVLAEDVPVLIVLDYDFAPGTQIMSRIHYALEHGAEPGLNEHLVGQESELVVAFGGGEDHGLVYRPTSDQLIEFVVDWGGSASIPSGLAEGREFIRQDAIGNTSGACVIESVTNDTTGPTDLSTIRAQVLLGNIQAGATVYFEALDGTRTQGTVVSDPEPFAVQSPSLTQWTVFDGLLRGIAGARGNLQVECSAGNPGRVSCEHTGRISQDDVMVAQPTGIRGSSVTPPSWSGGRCEIAGVPVRGRSFSFNLNTTVSRRPNANAPEGTEEFAITDRDPVLQLTYDRPGVAILDTNKRWKFATWTPLAVFVGQSEGNRVGIVVPRGQVKSPSDGDEDGTLTLQVDFEARRIGQDGDDVFVVVR